MKLYSTPPPSDELARFLLHSQFRAAISMACFCGLLIVIQTVIIALQPISLDEGFHKSTLLLLPLLVGAVAAIELVYARSIHAHLQRGDDAPHRALPTVAAIGEAMLPTFGIVLICFSSDWSTALLSPPVSGYFIILLLSILRMDGRMCLFIGGIEALSFLALIAISPTTSNLGFLLGTAFLILIASGIAAGIVRVARGLVSDLITSHQAETQAARAQKQAEAAVWQKDHLLAILSHDLRAPLNGINTLSEMIASVPDQFTPTEIRNHAREIQQTSQHLRELLDNLLSWARLRTSQLPLSPTKHCASDLIEPVLELFKLQFALKSIHLSSQPSGFLTTDRDLFQTILRNLISNALKFTPVGGSVSIKTEDTADGFTLSVIDSGPGLPNGIAKQVVEGSFTASTPGTSGEAGSGLGLLLCHELAQQLKGSLTFESIPGEGLSAHLRLPINPPSEIRA